MCETAARSKSCSRQNFHSAKFLRGETAARKITAGRKLRVAKFPAGKFSIREISGGEFSNREFTCHDFDNDLLISLVAHNTYKILNASLK